MAILVFITLMIFCALPGGAWAAGVSVDAQVDLTEITIGDRVNLEVVITADTTLEVVLPDMEILLGMSVLKHVEFTQRGDTLILRPHE